MLVVLRTQLQATGLGMVFRASFLAPDLARLRTAEGGGRGLEAQDIGNAPESPVPAPEQGREGLGEREEMGEEEEGKIR